MLKFHCVDASRLQKAGKLPGKAFVPLSFELGEAFQFDWSDEGLVVGGIFYKVQVSHLKLCASRAFWLVAYPSQGHEMLFDAHTRSFQALGGVTRRGIYDNMKTAVDKVKKGKGRIVNARFAAMCSHYLFDPDFCNVASGWEKGVVEKNVQDSRRRIWIEAGTRRFGSFIELNAWLGERCRSIWADTGHPVHKQFTVAEMLELERPHLMNMPAPFDGYVEKSARVSSTCLVTVARNRYSVPCEWAGHMVSTRLYGVQLHMEQSGMTVKDLRWPYAVFFASLASLVGVGFGSAYYHLAPSHGSLFWDRLPMSLAFMSLFSAVLVERLGPRVGLRLFPWLAAAGPFSVVYWIWSERADVGDLRLYGLVHFYPMLLIPLLMWLFAPRYTRGGDLLWVLALYATALAAERLDREVFAAGGWISGHTVKHVLAAVAAAWLSRMLRLRSPAPGASQVR